MENGHRHANRRGPPRGLKEMEISASTSDGKPSKRASANYGAHEASVGSKIKLGDVILSNDDTHQNKYCKLWSSGFCSLIL